MVKNRFFKNTLGIFAEIVIAAALDVEETSGTGGRASTVAVLATLAANGANGETITITVDGVQYLYTVSGTPTAAVMHDDIVAMLAANTQGFVVATHSGTTSSIFNLSWAGADKNGKVVSLVETGTSFTVAGPYSFAGGVDADAAASDDVESFAANSNAGTIWAFWEDIDSDGRHNALKAGDTSNPANINRKFFYAWKDSAGNMKSTTAIPVRGLKYNTAAYNAGTFGVHTVAYGGTVSNGQILHVRIQDTTAGQLPFPSYSYSAIVAGGTADSAVASIAAQITAETDQRIVGGSASTSTLTVTSIDKTRTFKVNAYLEVTTAQPTDASAIVVTETVKAVAPLGDATFIAELAEYYNIYSGGINYPQAGTNLTEWQTAYSNHTAASQWGILMVSAPRTDEGVTNTHTAKGYVIVAVPTGSETTLAAL